MFCWMDSDEIRKQFYKTDVDPKEVELALGKAPNVSEFIGKIFGVEELKENMEFVKSFKSFTAEKKNCEKLFKLIKRKTTIKEVFVYPENKHLDVLVNLDSVLDIDKNVKAQLKPMKGDVYVVENGNKPNSETWENLGWDENGQLITIAGVVGPKGCFYPFERPTNGAVSLRFRLDQNYESKCLGASNHFDELHHVYSLIIGKVTATSHTIRPIFFYDLGTEEGKKEMKSYLESWYNIFKDITSKELYGERIPDSNKEVDEVITMIIGNKYKAGEWLQAEGQLTSQMDYLMELRRVKRLVAFGNKNLVNEEPAHKREKVKRYNIWRCESYYAYKGN